MTRYRSRSPSRSYSPRRRSRTPPRGRKRYDDDEPRDRYRDSRSYRDRRSPAPSGLLVRNLPLDARYFSISLCMDVDVYIFVFCVLNNLVGFICLCGLFFKCVKVGAKLQGRNQKCSKRGADSNVKSNFICTVGVYCYSRIEIS